MKQIENKFLLKKSSVLIKAEAKIAAQYGSKFRSQTKPSGHFLYRKVQPSQEEMEQTEIKSNPQLKL